MDPARQALRDFVATSHEKFMFQFVHFHNETRDFMVDLASELSQVLSYKEAVETTCEQNDAGSIMWRARRLKDSVNLFCFGALCTYSDWTLK